MKKFRLLAILAIAAVTMTSCELFGGGPGEEKARFIAFTEKQTRTTMGDNYSVLWSEGDQIVMLGIDASQRLYDGGVFTLAEGAGQSVGVFEGTLETEYPNYYALYPAQSFEQFTLEGDILFNASPNAVFAEKNFVDTANPMFATGTKESGLQFRNIFGILELQLKGSGNITDIRVDVGAEDGFIAGSFLVSPSLEVFPYGSLSKTILAKLEQPITLSQTEARSIYAILPPAEYKQLRITTTDDAGNVTTRVAKNPIKIERAVITPVSEFEHQTVEAPHATVTYLEEISDFYYARFRVGLNNIATGAYLAIMDDSKYQEYLSQGLTDKQIVEQYASSNITASNDYNLQVYDKMGSTIHLIALPYGEGDSLGEVAKCSFVAKSVPVDSSYSVNIAGEPTITTNSISVRFNAVPAEGVFRAQIWESANYATLPAFYADIFSATTNAWTTLQYTGGAIDLVRDNLAPNTEYTLVYRVANGIENGVFDGNFTAYSDYKIYTFKTDSYDKSNASVSLSMSEVKDWSATVAISLQNASKFKMFLTQESLGENPEHLIDQNGGEFEPSVSSHVLTNLTENTKYYLYAVAYDANGVYGTYSSVEFTTTALQAEPNAEYSKFLGTYTFSSQNGVFDNNPRTVTISQGIEGKTFRVTGLVHPNACASYGIADDTIVAKFLDNMIYIGTVLEATVSGQPFSHIYTGAFNGAQLYLNSPLVSAYNNGVLTFSYPLDSTFTGFIFYLSDNGGYNGGYLDYYTNLVLTKDGAGGGGGSSDGNSTEGFSRNDNETDAGWN